MIASLGLVRTSAPVAEEATTAAYSLEIKSDAEPVGTDGPWPIVHDDVYPEAAQIRGTLRLRANAPAPAKVRLIVAAQGDKAQQVGCLPGDAPACHFVADLRPATLTRGVVITVIDADSNRPIAPPSRFAFTRRVSYSSAWWTGSMGI